MLMQLTFDLTTRLPKAKLIFKIPTWMDVSDVARGVGFAAKVEVSTALNDALAPLQTEEEEDYDQRLYDALWLAHHYQSLDPRSSFTFTFDFLRDDKLAGKYVETSLRLRVEERNRVLLLGLSQDF